MVESQRFFTLEGHIDHALLTARQCEGSPRVKLAAAARDLVSAGHLEYTNGIGECRIGDNKIFYIRTPTPDTLTLTCTNYGSLMVQPLDVWREWAEEELEEETPAYLVIHIAENGEVRIFWSSKDRLLDSLHEGEYGKLEDLLIHEEVGSKSYVGAWTPGLYVFDAKMMLPVCDGKGDSVVDFEKGH